MCLIWTYKYYRRVPIKETIRLSFNTKKSSNPLANSSTSTHSLLVPKTQTLYKKQSLHTLYIWFVTFISAYMSNASG